MVPAVNAILEKERESVLSARVRMSHRPPWDWDTVPYDAVIHPKRRGGVRGNYLGLKNKIYTGQRRRLSRRSVIGRGTDIATSIYDEADEESHGVPIALGDCFTSMPLFVTCRHRRARDAIYYFASRRAATRTRTTSSSVEDCETRSLAVLHACRDFATKLPLNYALLSDPRRKTDVPFNRSDRFIFVARQNFAFCVSVHVTSIVCVAIDARKAQNIEVDLF